MKLEKLLQTGLLLAILIITLVPAVIAFDETATKRLTDYSVEQIAEAAKGRLTIALDCLFDKYTADPSITPSFKTKTAIYYAIYCPEDTMVHKGDIFKDYSLTMGSLTFSDFNFYQGVKEEKWEDKSGEAKEKEYRTDSSIRRFRRFALFCLISNKQNTGTFLDTVLEAIRVEGRPDQTSSRALSVKKAAEMAIAYATHLKEEGAIEEEEDHMERMREIYILSKKDPAFQYLFNTHGPKDVESIGNHLIPKKTTARKAIERANERFVETFVFRRIQDGLSPDDIIEFLQETIRVLEEKYANYIN